MEMMIEVSQDLKKKAEQAALARGLSLDAFVREALEQVLNPTERSAEEPESREPLTEMDAWLAECDQVAELWEGEFDAAADIQQTPADAASHVFHLHSAESRQFLQHSVEQRQGVVDIKVIPICVAPSSMKQTVKQAPGIAAKAVAHQHDQEHRDEDEGQDDPSDYEGNDCPLFP